MVGFKALASTSAGAAWAMGRNNGELSLDDVLDHLRLLCAATDLPVNADFEAGFAEDPEGVAANVTVAIENGYCGIVDRGSNRACPLRSTGCSGSDQGRSRSHCTFRPRRPIGWPFRGLPRRAHGVEHNHRKTRRLCGCRCRLPLRSGHHGSFRDPDPGFSCRAEARQCSAHWA